MPLAISRRRLLQGSGIALGLPWLEAMTPLKAAVAASGSSVPMRLGFFYVPNGVNMDQWRIEDKGRIEKWSPILQPLEAVGDRVTLITGLRADHCKQPTAGHEPTGGGFLVGDLCKHSENPEVANTSIDQIVAKETGLETPIDSLALGIDPGHRGDHGFSGTYLSHISWRSSRTPVPLEINPRELFDRLYGGRVPQRRGERTIDNGPQTARGSILDYVMEDAASLQRQVGYEDRQRLDEYTSSVRAVERRIQLSEASPETHHDAAFDDDPELAAAYRDIEHRMIDDGRGIPELYADHVNLLLDILVLAFQADTTRVASFMFSMEKSGRSYKELGISGSHHSRSHHQKEQENLDALTAINRHHAELFSRFLQRLAATPEGDGNLLDHSLIMYGSGISDGNRHNHDDLPILVAGGGGQNLPGRRHLHLGGDRPLCDLYLTMARSAGLQMERFGDSNTPLDLS